MKYEDLADAFNFVSSGGPWEHPAYISLETGRIYWDTDSGEEELPKDLGESDQWLAVPHKNDLDLGRDPVLRFVAAELPQQYARVEGQLLTPRGMTRRGRWFSGVGCGTRREPGGQPSNDDCLPAESG